MAGEIDSVELAGHLDVGENRLNRGPLIKDHQGLVGIGRAKHRKPSPSRTSTDVFPDEGLVLDDEDDGVLAGAIAHAFETAVHRHGSSARSFRGFE